MGRINIFLNDKLLDEIKQEAMREGHTPSALIQTAVRKYIEDKRFARNGQTKRMEEASRKMDALAKKLGDWNPQTTIRKFRDTNLKRGS